LYHALYGRLASQLYVYLGDRAEAEDVVQDAFARAWQHWPKLRQYDDPVAWVRRVAWNLATSRLRRITTAARALRRQRPQHVVPEPNPDHVLLVVALRRLPDRQRLVLVLHHLCDYSVAEIASDLGVPQGTVMSWLYRGRARLAAQLRPETVQG
jgi:RNA polymerase sigma-70 factor (ECF subfamily)